MRLATATITMIVMVVTMKTLPSLGQAFFASSLRITNRIRHSCHCDPIQDDTAATATTRMHEKEKSMKNHRQCLGCFTRADCDEGLPRQRLSSLSEVRYHNYHNNNFVNDHHHHFSNQGKDCRNAAADDTTIMITTTPTFGQPPRRRLFLQCSVVTPLLFSMLGFPLNTPAASTPSIEQQQQPNNRDILCSDDGALMPEQAIAGSYEQACMRLSVRNVPIRVPLLQQEQHHHQQYKTIVLSLAQGAAGAGTTGLAVWNSSLLLSRLLQELVLARASNNNNSNNPAAELLWPFTASPPRQILELGCGAGLISLTAALVFAGNHKKNENNNNNSDATAVHVVATDGNPAVVDLCERNIQSNKNHLLTDDNDSSSNSSNSIAQVEARSLQWGSLDIYDYADSFDLVLGSDLTYASQAWPGLAETMSVVLKPKANGNSNGGIAGNAGGGRVLYLSTAHAGFSVQAELDGFLTVAAQKGLRLDTVASQALTRFVYETCLRTDAERAIVQSTGGGVKVLVLERK